MALLKSLRLMGGNDDKHATSDRDEDWESMPVVSRVGKWQVLEYGFKDNTESGRDGACTTNEDYVIARCVCGEHYYMPYAYLTTRKDCLCGMSAGGRGGVARQPLASRTENQKHVEGAGEAAGRIAGKMQSRAQKLGRNGRLIGRPRIDANSPMRPTGFSLPEDLTEDFRRYCREQQISVSSVIAQLMKEFLDAQAGQVDEE